MSRFGSGSYVLLLALLATLALCPGLHAQDSGLLRQRELRADGSARLYDAIAQLRPSWLQLGGDSVAGVAVSRVVVFVNGLHRGDARVLYSIPTSEVLSARLRTSEFVRRTDPRFPRQEFDVAIYVATRAENAIQREGRITFAVDAGFGLRGAPQSMRASLEQQGYDSQILLTDREHAVFNRRGNARPVLVGANVHVGVGGPWGVAVTGQRSLEGWSGAYSYDTDLAISADLVSTEGALLATRQMGRLRVGAGAAYRDLRMDWAAGFCQCVEEVTNSSRAVGVASEAAFELPVSSVVFPTFRMAARYYPSQTARYDALDTEIDMSGFVLTMNLGVAARF